MIRVRVIPRLDRRVFHRRAVGSGDADFRNQIVSIFVGHLAQGDQRRGPTGLTVRRCKHQSQRDEEDISPLFPSLQGRIGANSRFDINRIKQVRLRILSPPHHSLAKDEAGKIPKLISSLPVAHDPKTKS